MIDRYVADVVARLRADRAVADVSSLLDAPTGARAGAGAFQALQRIALGQPQQTQQTRQTSSEPTTTPQQEDEQ